MLGFFGQIVVVVPDAWVKPQGFVYPIPDASQDIWEFSRPMMAALFALLLSLLSMTFRWSLIVGDGPILICDHHFLRSSAEVRGSPIPAKDWHL